MMISKNSPRASSDVTTRPAAAHRVGVLSTPALSLDLDAVTHNIDTMAAWCADAGVDLAPHGKTTMMPEIWRRQLDAGAWGITVATAFQAEVAKDAGVTNIIMAGSAFAPDVLRSLLDGPADVLMWIDSLAGVQLLNDALAAAAGQASPLEMGEARPLVGVGKARPLAVLVEFGSVLGRTGARSVHETVRIAEAVHNADHLVLAGVAGYEGALTHGVDDEALSVIDDYLLALRDVLDTIPVQHFAPWLDSGHDVILTAGGSVYFDRVASVLSSRHDPLGERGPRTRVVLRSGSYVAHDHGLYTRLTPFARVNHSTAAAHPPFFFEPALELWATVISRPQADLALLNIGRRDASDDEGFPIPLDVWRAGGSDKHSSDVLDGAAVTALNDQHAFLRVAVESSIGVGDLVRLGISHPCTTFDKWAEIAVVRGFTTERADPPLIENFLPTHF
jgi:D-serine deaminase-like pyridoxal phosphate-dependent protein